ncbi:MAG: hypothetical protein D6812_04135, partial [Deltaproteobacteria bacterium]
MSKKLVLLSLFILLGSVSLAEAAPRKLLDPGIRVDPTSSPVTNARHVLVELRDRLGIEIDDLRVDAVRRGKTGHHVRFLQHYRGIPVWEGYVSVHTNDQGRVQLVENRWVPGLDLPVVPHISAAEAIEIARETIALRRTRGEIRSRLLIDPSPPDPALVWEVWIPALDPLGDWRIFVDAVQGAPRTKWNELFFDSGYVYNPSALQDTGNTALRDNNNADTPELTAARSLVTLSGLTDNVLVGPYVDLCATGIGGAYKPAC